MKTIAECEYKKIDLLKQNEALISERTKKCSQRDILKKKVKNYKIAIIIITILAIYSIVYYCAFLNFISSIICLVFYSIILLLLWHIRKKKKPMLISADEELKELDQQSNHIIDQICMIDDTLQKIDIDLYNIQMTPENINRLEEEAISLFYHKAKYHPEFKLLKDCWLLRYTNYTFLGEGAEESKRKNDICQKKLKNSGSWILELTNQFWSLYQLEFMGAVMKDVGLPWDDRLLVFKPDEDFRAAETQREDEFLTVFIEALIDMGYDIGDDIFSYHMICKEED